MSEIVTIAMGDGEIKYLPRPEGHKEELWLHVFKNALSEARARQTALFGGDPIKLASKEADEALRLFGERFDPAPITTQ